ncbi:uncharacterized protein TNCV_4296671 [Trichonephila clavipes]|nr:uncharacterized protein TNCV_4296671 [Trichonephila clavipes]
MEYRLSEYSQHRGKWMIEKDNVMCGTMVIVKEDFIRVCSWILGRVVEVYHGSDVKKNHSVLLVKWVGFRLTLGLKQNDVTDFHILLPSNSSMKVFPLNTPDNFRTKLARSITLNGEWECCLSEATIPEKYFTVQPNYNDFYSIQNEIDVETETLLPKFDIPLYNDDHADFVAEFNANMKKNFIDPPLVFTLLTADSQVRLHVPQNILVTFGERLKDLLGFVQRTFTHGDYKSEYPLELRAGIAEIYVYCDVVSESLVGDSSASILKIIPVGNEHSDQIIKYFTAPLYFGVKKQFFDLRYPTTFGTVILKGT